MEIGDNKEKIENFVWYSESLVATVHSFARCSSTSIKHFDPFYFTQNTARWEPEGRVEYYVAFVFRDKSRSKFKEKTKKDIDFQQKKIILWTHNKKKRIFITFMLNISTEKALKSLQSFPHFLYPTIFIPFHTLLFHPLHSYQSNWNS